MHNTRTKLLEIIAHRKYQSYTDMTVPKLTRNHFEEFYLAFQRDSRNRVRLSEILLEYLLRLNDASNYDAVWNSRE